LNEIIFHYSRFWLSIEGRSEEWDEVVIALTAYQKHVSRSPLPNAPFERVDNITFTPYRPLNWFNIAYYVFLSKFGAESDDNKIRVQSSQYSYARFPRFSHEFARFQTPVDDNLIQSPFLFYPFLSLLRSLAA
jgi:hypothetical protein